MNSMLIVLRYSQEMQSRYPLGAVFRMMFYIQGYGKPTLGQRLRV